MSCHSPCSCINDDLTLLSDTLEALLNASGDPADQHYIALKMRAERVLNEVKARASQAPGSYYCRAKDAVCQADDYLHDNPWQGVGAAAAVGLFLGLLLARR